MKPVTCVLCKQKGLSSRLYPVPPYYRYDGIMGYYDENGKYIPPSLMACYYCSNGHFYEERWE